MTDHPITPPPELVEQWKAELPTGVFDGYKFPQREQALCIQAARWGADQELEACCAWLRDVDRWKTVADRLRLARRPQPSSLKERALQAWAAVEAGTDDQTAMAVIRRALEALPE